MKVAIILSGQSRTWKLCKHFLKNMILDRYDCDIFLGIDINNKTQLLYKNSQSCTDDIEVKQILDFYKPVSYYITNNNTEQEIDNIINEIPIGRIFGYETISDDETQKNIYNYLINQDSQYLKESLKINDTYFKSPTTKIIDGHINKNSIYGLIRQYYFLGKTYELVKKHITKTGSKYDLVIRIRFDHIIWNDEFNNKELYDFDKVIPPERENHAHQDIKYTEKNIQLSEILTKGKEVLLDTYEVNTIKVLGGGVIQNYTYVNDFFWTHGHDLIDKMTLFGEKLKDIIMNSIKTGWPMHGAGIEHFLSVFLFKQNINIKPTIMNKMTIVREL